MLKFFNFWVLGTLALYYFGPIPWSNNDTPVVAFYVILNLLFFNGGYFFTGRNAKLYSINISVSPATSYFLISLFMAFTAIQIYDLTGKFIFNPADYSFAFGDIYSNFLKTLQERQQSTLVVLITLMKMAIYPIILYIFVDSLGKNWIKVGLIGFSFVASSLMRGTDKELMDVGILIAVIMYYKRFFNWKTVSVILLVPIFLFSFLLKRVDRFGGNLPICLPDRITCFDFNSWLADLSPDLEILYVFLASYISQGYFALGIALDFNADWGAGIGHLGPVKTIICKATEYGCNVLDYETVLSRAGWDTRYQWTSVYPILANDFTFFGVPLYLLMLGVVFKLSETTWRSNQSNAALCALVLIVQFFVFSSANMQITVSPDSVAATFAFVYIPLLLTLLRIKKT